MALACPVKRGVASRLMIVDGRGLRSAPSRVPQGLRRLAPGFNLGVTAAIPSAKVPQGRRRWPRQLPHVFSFEYVSQVIIDVMPFQHGQKLVFKTQLAVVLLLRLDVLPDRGHLGHADGERAVAGLPFKFYLQSLLAVYPFRRISFDVLQHLRGRRSSGESPPGCGRGPECRQSR